MVKRTYSKHNKQAPSSSGRSTWFRHDNEKRRKIGTGIEPDRMPSQSRDCVSKFSISSSTTYVAEATLKDHENAPKDHTTAWKNHETPEPRPDASQLARAPKKNETRKRGSDLLTKHLTASQAELWAENQSESPLLRLPRELRQQIYELALGEQLIDIKFVTYEYHETQLIPRFKYTRKIHYYDSYNNRPVIQKPPGELTFLNNVCRQLYHETSLLPYSLGALMFRSHNTMFNFLFMERRFTRVQSDAIKTLIVFERLPDTNLIELLRNLKWVFLNKVGWYKVVRDGTPTLTEE